MKQFSPPILPAALVQKLAGTLFGRPLGVFDIRDYGALQSPNDIGPSVQRAGDAAIAHGGGMIFIPPREDGTRQWGWTTAVLLSAAQSMSLNVQGVPGDTAIQLQVGQATPLTFPNSNGICQVDGLIFTGAGVLGDVNSACVIDFQQARIGILTRCQFFGVACNGAGQGLVRLVADTTHVSDCIFNGCNYSGPAFQGGQLSITGNRDASIVENCRFTAVDGTFDGVAYTKQDFATNWAFLWYGGQGVDGVVTAYGEVQTKRCYFESEARNAIEVNPEAGLISAHHRIEGCTFNIGAGGGPRPGIRFATDNGGTPSKSCDVEGCMFGNAASGVDAIIFVGDRLSVKDTININQALHTYNVTLSGATQLLELIESPGYIPNPGAFAGVTYVTSLGVKSIWLTSAGAVDKGDLLKVAAVGGVAGVDKIAAADATGLAQFVSLDTVAASGGVRAALPGQRVQMLSDGTTAIAIGDPVTSAGAGAAGQVKKAGALAPIEGIAMQAAAAGGGPVLFYANMQQGTS